MFPSASWPFLQLAHCVRFAKIFVSFHFFSFVVFISLNGQNIFSIDNSSGQNKFATVRFVIHLRQSPHISFRGKNIYLHFSRTLTPFLLNSVWFIAASRELRELFKISNAIRHLKSVKKPIQNLCKTMQLYEFFCIYLWFLKIETKADSFLWSIVVHMYANGFIEKLFKSKRNFWMKIMQCE